MNKKIKATMLVAAVIAAGFGGIKTYQSMSSTNENLLMQNVEALSAGGDDAGQTFRMDKVEYISVVDERGVCSRYGIDNERPIPVLDGKGNIINYKYHYSWSSQGDWVTCKNRPKNALELNAIFDFIPCVPKACVSGYNPYYTEPTYGVGYFISSENPFL